MRPTCFIWFCPNLGCPKIQGLVICSNQNCIFFFFYTGFCHENKPWSPCFLANLRCSPWTNNDQHILFFFFLTPPDHAIRWWCLDNTWVPQAGWWLTYTSEKSEKSSVGMMTFPTEWKVIKFHGSKPPTSKCSRPISKRS